MSWTRGTFAAGLVCAVLLGGCGADVDSDVAMRPADAAPPGQVATAAPAATATPAADPKAVRQLEIYSLVIRRLVTVDHTFGSGASPFQRVWVVDAPVPGAGSPGRKGERGERFDAALQAGLKRELADLPPLEFVPDADEVRQMGRDPEVKGGGVIVTVGPIEEHGDKIHVAHEIWCGGTCAEWFTYVIERRAGEWVVTGDTGVRAIS